MERLFARRPERTDGKHTKNNHWREAGVSHATVNRATTVLAESNLRTAQSPASLHDQRRSEEITRLRHKLRNDHTELRHLRQQVAAAATVIAALTAENAALRHRLATRSAAALPSPRH